MNFSGNIAASRPSLSAKARLHMSHDVIFNCAGHGLLSPDELTEFRRLRGQIGFTSMGAMALLPAHMIVLFNAKRSGDASKILRKNITSSILFVLGGGCLIYSGRQQSNYLTKMSSKYLKDLPDDDLRTI